MVWSPRLLGDRVEADPVASLDGAQGATAGSVLGAALADWGGAPQLMMNGS